MSTPLCSVCGSQPSTYVCQSCGRPTCRNCFDTSSWTCRACKLQTTPPSQGDSWTAPPTQYSLGSLLFLLAFAAIFIGMILVALGSLSSSTNPSASGIILIGPIPIILGAGPYSFDLIALSIGLTIVALVVFVFLLRRRL